ncbi:EAL and HDOD domain-containing protein [Egicoccus sp. AB-alg6-2]|uniref:EAL and HDOD domain-containing protein n=1 Tax=Egicoccus sp. AB-alg6-2 TaxID=3242692 RepID=UPI00359D00EA
MHDLLGEVLITRQPILTPQLEVVGYELLYREAESEDGPASHAPEDVRAAARVLVDGVLAMGLNELTGGEDAWVAVPVELLLEDALLDVPPTGLLLEVSGGAERVDELRAALTRHRTAGFRLVLADVHADDPRRELAHLVDVVKLTPADGWQAVVPLVRELAASGHRVAVAGVEDPDGFEALTAAGASLIQGFFFTRPRAVRGVRPLGLAPGHLALLRALAADEVDLAEVERLIRTDLTLSDRFLRLVHAACGWREVESIHHGLVLLGVRAVQRWVGLLLLSATSREAPRELVAVASARARGCELLEELRGGNRRLEAFTLGMFSVLGPDGLLDRDTLAALPIDGDVRQALEQGDGPLRELLELQLASEKAEWERLVHSGRRLGLAPRQLARAHADALTWSTTVKAAT